MPLQFRKKIVFTFLISFLSLQLILPQATVLAAISPQISDFLCEKGIFYYDQGRYPQALTEFKKALLANPESHVAQEYIDIIEGEKAAQEGVAQYLLTEKISAVNLFLKKIEALPATSQALVELKQAVQAQKKVEYLKVKSSSAVLAPKKTEEVIVDIDVLQGAQAVTEIEVNVGEYLVMKGKNILRFLITEPPFLNVERRSNDELLVEPKSIGSTYMHLWDDSGRKSFKFIIGPRKFEEALREEVRRKKEEANEPSSFKWSYSIQGDSFMLGRGFGDLERKNHVLAYTSAIIGETPYGNFDTSVQGTRTNLKTYRISNLRMGLTDAHYDQFKNINIRGFDLNPNFAAFGFPASDLRGVSVNAPMFNKKFDYTAFWGAIPAGNFTLLSSQSGLDRTKKAWLEGVGLNYKAGGFANFKSFYVHSYGPERSTPVLTDEIMGFGMDYNLGRLNLGTEAAYDANSHISYTARTSYTLSKLRLGLSMTEANKNFASIFGGEPASGYTSGNLTIDYRPTSEVTISNSFQGLRDKVFGNPDRPARPNYRSTTKLRWQPDIHTEYEAGYDMDDRIGSNSPSVVETKDITIRKKLFFFKRLSTFLNFQNRKSKNYSSPSLDFNNNRILAGLSFRVLSDLYLYYNKEFDLLRNKFSGETAYPTAQEIGLNYNRQIFDSPFYTYMRIAYRNEEDTESNLSFLSGQDRLDGEVELTFKPNRETETFLKGRVSNVWAEREAADKHLELDLSWGLRFVWDTGFRWNSMGSFDGFVFYDLNGDGRRQPGEKGVDNVEITGPGVKLARTDSKGYYKLSRITGRLVTLELNLKTLPKGYSPTAPTSREVDVVHAKTKRVDFGIATRTEVSGLIFNDKDSNGKYDAGEEAIKGVVVILDAKEKVATTLLGEYSFRKLSAGEHTLNLDLKSLPVKFIPKVPIIKKIKVLEGTTFVYNIPLQETK